MSARTSQASKAIRIAWNNEQELVREGKGTRDWTPQQQQDILDRGRAYDETGRAFEGHHMKSVSAYPEYQGDPNNIQFLSRNEHVRAHFDDVHNPTNGYYNPETGETKDFGNNQPEPCKRIELSESINNVKLDSSSTKKTIEERVESKAQKRNNENNAREHQKSDGSFLTHTVNKAFDIYDKYSHIIKLAAKTIGVLVSSYNAVKASGGGNRTNNDSYSTLDNSSSKSIFDDIIPQSETSGQTTHASPSEHTVKAHGQHYGKDKIWKEKAPYTRGSNKKTN